MGVTFPEVTGDVLAHEPVIQLRACLPRNKSPPASGSSEYMHKLRGCNINFEHQGACKSVLLPEQTKLQAAAFDRNAQEAQMANYHSNQMQTRRNKSLNQVDQIALSFADDGGNPFTRHTMSSSLRKTQAETNYKDLLARRDHIKGIHHGSMGNEFLYHSTGNSAGECVQVRNTAKQLPMLDAFIGAERLPGAPVNVFKTMGYTNKARFATTSVDLSIPMKADGQNEWKRKYRTPSSIYNAPAALHTGPKDIKMNCSKQTIDLRHHGGTPEHVAQRSHNTPIWGQYSQ
mmetsp:Transcript_44820/g.85703  ORF Transcript_44820/g.85703 Transcript_44820/m.85703 type:complete len:288 (+) Transcript_44820:118-981(+)